MQVQVCWRPLPFALHFQVSQYLKPPQGQESSTKLTGSGRPPSLMSRSSLMGTYNKAQMQFPMEAQPAQRPALVLKTRHD